MLCYVTIAMLMQLQIQDILIATPHQMHQCAVRADSDAKLCHGMHMTDAVLRTAGQLSVCIKTKYCPVQECRGQAIASKLGCNDKGCLTCFKLFLAGWPDPGNDLRHSHSNSLKESC